MESHAAGQLHDDLEILIFMHVEMSDCYGVKCPSGQWTMQLFKLPA